MCWKPALPCVQSGEGVGLNTCKAYYRCAEEDGQYLIKWKCSEGEGKQDLTSNVTMCAKPNPSSSCKAPVVCPSRNWQTVTIRPTDNFPTEVVIGGTLGALSLIAIVFIILAAVRKWQLKRRNSSISTILSSRHHIKHHHRPMKKTRLVPWFGEPVFAYDLPVREKAYRAYDNFATDVYFPAAHSTPRAERTGGFHDDSSDNALFTVGDESRYEPSIIAGSFVYHPPTNLPPHLTGDVHQNLSYDSFKNEHLYDINGRGVVSSTLNNHHQPPDFYL